MAAVALALLAGAGGCGRGGIGSVITGTTPSSPARSVWVAPRNGLEVIGAMRRAHPSRALKSLSYSVSTVEFEADTTRVTEARALASLPGRFREHLVPDRRRTGFVRDRQQLAVFERGARTAMLRRVDLVSLLAFDVFAQSIDTTIMWLDSTRMRYGLARRAWLDGREVWVVGAEEDDMTSPQFWVDADRWRVLRVIQRNPLRPSEITDARFSDFDMVLDVPVPKRIEIYRDGKLSERRVVSDVSVNPKLPRNAFDLSRLRDVR